MADDTIAVTPKIEVTAGQSPAKKATDLTTLASALSGTGLAAYLLAVALPAMESRQIERVNECKGMIVEGNRMTQLTRDEMRDLRHDATEIRHTLEGRAKVAPPEKP